jgi:hypothetical protein
MGDLDPLECSSLREGIVVAYHAPPKKSHKLRNGLLIALGVFVVLVIIGYLVPKEGKDKSAASSESTTTAVTTTPPGYISEATWTDGEWPFTVPEGALMCTDLRLKHVTFTANGVTYAANGTARLAGMFADITAIMRDNPAIPGTKVNMRPVVQRGLALCGR